MGERVGAAVLEVRRTRPKIVRLGMAALIVVAGVAPLVALVELVQPTLDDRWFYLVGYGIPALLTAGLCPLVSYRWFDGLQWFIPIIGPFAGFLLLCKVAWRVTNLPHQDWPLRSGEVAQG